MPTLSRRVAEAVYRLLFDGIELSAHVLPPRRVALERRQRVGRQWSTFRHAQLRELFSSLAQVELETTDAVARHRRLHPVHNPRAFAHQVLMLTVGPLRVFLRKRGDLHHAAVFGFPTQPTQNRSL